MVERRARVSCSTTISAHAGVIHRDVKPDNVLVRDADGHTIVLDFGLAKLVRPEGEQATR